MFRKEYASGLLICCSVSCLHLMVRIFFQTALILRVKNNKRMQESKDEEKNHHIRVFLDKKSKRKMKKNFLILFINFIKK